jgi:PAS domain S-box-containing protein
MELMEITEINERKKAEDAVRASQAQLETLFNAAPLGIYLVDGDFRIRQVNPAALPVFGAIPDVIGRDFGEVIHLLWPEGYADDLVRLFRHTLETGDPYSSPEWSEKRRDRGEAEYYEWQINRIRFPDGSFGVVCYFRDISSQVRARQANVESEEKYQTLFNSIDEGFFLIDVIFDEDDRPVDIYYVEANAAATRMLGLDFTGRRLREINPNYEEYWYEIFGEVARTGQSMRMQQYAEPDKRWYSFYVFRIGGPESRRIGNIFQDITERRKTDEALQKARDTLEATVTVRTVELAGTIERLKMEVDQRAAAEDILRANEALLRTVLETPPVGVGIIDPKGRVSYLNPAMIAIWEGEVTECAGCRMWKPGSDVPLLPAEQPATVALRTDKPVLGVVLDVETVTGKRKTVITSASPILLPDGSKSGGVCVVQDITQQQELQKQLLHTQKLESIGSLAGGIAHDFNNILTAICGYTESVYGELESGDLREELRQVLDAGERASELTRNLLAFSRQQVTETAPMSLTETVENVLTFVSRLIGAQIEVRRELSPDRLMIQGSRGQVDQVLVNILLNARDAICGTGSVTVRTGKVAAADTVAGLPREGNYAFVEISDTGEGIPQQNLDRIFEPYFTTKEQGKGTGLGMAIAYGIVRQHHGTVTVASAVGKGTTFTVYFPLTSRRGRGGAGTGAGRAPPGERDGSRGRGRHRRPVVPGENAAKSRIPGDRSRGRLRGAGCGTGASGGDGSDGRDHAGNERDGDVPPDEGASAGPEGHLCQRLFSRHSDRHGRRRRRIPLHPETGRQGDAPRYDP